MKKIFCAVIVVLMFAALVNPAERKVIRLGLLSKLNTTEEEFAQTWQKTFAPKNEELEVIVRFYDSLAAMQMAMNRREIHEMVLPEAAAQYILNMNPELEATLTLRSKGMGLAFGFREDSGELRDKFNSALSELRDNWTLSVLEGRYLSSRNDPSPAEFRHFDGAATIRVAITGDLPPLDYIASDGTPAGFNTAILAEIGNILHVNVELLEIDAGARTAALTSGRADVVFWYEVSPQAQTQPDVPEGVMLSQPYYEWEKFIHVRKAPPQASSSSWWDFRDGILGLYF
ncbi:MAG: transporter substrate-binding domain-containing protein [Synergistaceae bacterium]|nr:transporter substrate-binding domain-containing protein [Synergistaceae bacterium]